MWEMVQWYPKPCLSAHIIVIAVRLSVELWAIHRHFMSDVIT